jgi:uncharacterized membrane protein
VESERLQAMVLAALFASAPFLLSALLIPLLSRAAKGRLPRNQWVGIRTPSTMRSDQAWMAGHRAALRLAPLYLLTTVVTCVALLVAALFGSTVNIVVLVGLGGFALVLVATFCSAVVAGRAAKKADGYPDNRQRQ